MASVLAVVLVNPKRGTVLVHFENVVCDNDVVFSDGPNIVFVQVLCANTAWAKGVGRDV